MSESKSTKPVRKEEVEKTTLVSAVVPYVPCVDDADKDPAQVTVKLPNGNKYSIAYITLSSNLESFLNKSINAKNLVLKDLGHKVEAEKIEKELRETNERIDKLEANPVKIIPVSAKRKDQSVRTPDEIKEEEAKRLKIAQEAREKQLNDLAAKYIRLESQLKDKILKMLDTFRGYIGEDLRHVWDDIIQSKFGTKPWTNLQGVENDEEELEYNLDAFELAWMFWMRHVFQEDAAEQNLEYLNFGIRRPWKVPPRVFVMRVSQISGYTSYLPCAYYSPMATSQTTIPQKLTDPQLAQLALRLCPEKWKHMWKAYDKGQPQDLEEMIKFMEQQEGIDKSNRVKKPQHDGNNKGTKRKGESQNNQGSSKKTKRCALCVKHGGPEKSHNTADCRIYNSDGTRKQRKSGGEDKTNHNFAQQLKEYKSELKECNEKLARLLKKRSYDDMDEDA